MCGTYAAQPRPIMFETYYVRDTCGATFDQSCLGVHTVRIKLSYRLNTRPTLPTKKTIKVEASKYQNVKQRYIQYTSLTGVTGAGCEKRPK